MRGARYQADAAADGILAAHWLSVAAERSLAAVAFEDALRDLDAARTVLRDDNTKAMVGVLEMRARALRGLARIDDALAALAEALDIAPTGRQRDEVLRARACLKLDLFRGREAIDDLEPLLAHARQADDRRNEVALLLLRSRGLYIL